MQGLVSEGGPGSVLWPAYHARSACDRVKGCFKARLRHPQLGADAGFTLVTLKRHPHLLALKLPKFTHTHPVWDN